MTPPSSTGRWKRAPRLVVGGVSTGLLFFLFIAGTAAAVPGEVSAAVYYPQAANDPANAMSVNTSALPEVNFTIDLEVSVTNSGYRTFSVTVAFSYDVYMPATNSPASGWNITTKPEKRAYQVAPRGSVTDKLAVNVTVLGDGEASNDTHFETYLTLTSDAPITQQQNGGFTLAIVLNDGGSREGSPAGLPPAAIGSTADLVLPVAAGLVAVGVAAFAYHRMRGPQRPAGPIIARARKLLGRQPRA